MEFASSSTESKHADNIFLNTVKIHECNIQYGVKLDWQKTADDISITLKLDVGRDFMPELYIGGQFKTDELSGEVSGWGTAYKVKLLFDAIGFPLRLSKGKTKEHQRLPEDAPNILNGKEFVRLSYKSTRLKQNGDNRINDWQQVAKIGDEKDLKDAFHKAVSNNWVKDFLDPSQETNNHQATEHSNTELEDVPPV
tara:strand:- start:479 stop:1066 length:588 start_codon:yes stop_codon:yes gene_type:complete